MRLTLFFLIGFLVLNCNSKKSVLTEKEFTKVYFDSLSKRLPAVKFVINSDLTITSTNGDKDLLHHLDNAFISYKAEPDSIKEVINRYIAASMDLYSDEKPIVIESILPVIKPSEYLEQINSLNKDGNTFPMITEKYNEQLIIAYAEDSKNSIKYLTEEDFKTLSISRDSLKVIALRNFDKIIPNIERRGDNGIYMITAGGDYEASLVLLTSIWTKEFFPVDGDIIVAIPNRDMLMITGSNNKEGIEKIKRIVDDSYKTGNYPVSEHLFKWTGKKFEKYD